MSINRHSTVANGKGQMGNAAGAPPPQSPIPREFRMRVYFRITRRAGGAEADCNQFLTTFRYSEPRARINSCGMLSGKGSSLTPGNRACVPGRSVLLSLVGLSQRHSSFLPSSLRSSFQQHHLRIWLLRTTVTMKQRLGTSDGLRNRLVSPSPRSVVIPCFPSPFQSIEVFVWLGR